MNETWISAIFLTNSVDMVGVEFSLLFLTYRTFESLVIYSP